MIQGFTFNNAMFKTIVQSGGRISIPEAERNALNIQEGDLVQVIVIPISKRKKKD
jgi:AbrB family looped-hinge helix DNA binding protein